VTKQSAYAATLLGAATAEEKKKPLNKDKPHNTSKTKALKLSKKQKRKDKQAEFLKKLKIVQGGQGDDNKSVPKLSSFGDISTSLDDVVASSKRGLKKAKKRTNRQKKRLIAEEVKNFCGVLQHPAFKNDPLNTINEHLKNSIKAKQELEDFDADVDNLDEAMKS